MEEKTMKNYLMFLLLAISLVLGACSNTEKTTSAKTSTDTKSSENMDLPAQNEAEVTVTSKEQEETTDLPDFFDIQLNTESNRVELLYPGGKPVVLADDIPSEPLKSPNGQKAAYISPWEMEESSNLYIVDLQDGSQDILVSTADTEYQPKDVIWEDDEHVMVIIGYRYGTVDVGGSIYRINIETKEQEVIKPSGGNTQITDLERIEDKVLYYNGIQYIDDIQNEYKEYSDQISL
jgi:hypothetical protein